MARLISSMGGFFPENSPMIWPSNITRIRSDISSTSSKSALMRRMPTPRSRASIIWSWTKRVAPMSRPRVGWTATSSSGWDSSSRARMTFCWLPPERLRTSCPVEVQRTSYFSTIFSAWALMALFFKSRPFPRLNASLPMLLSTRLSAMDMSPIKPWRFRSSGTWETPSSMKAEGS